MSGFQSILGFTLANNAMIAARMPLRRPNLRTGLRKKGRGGGSPASPAALYVQFIETLARDARDATHFDQIGVLDMACSYGTGLVRMRISKIDLTQQLTDPRC